ncbi:33 kDa ribonucleoprotein, chloroplastic-like [Abrus precatorius]|uniref:33 kDa ribonucleoprotein, chloroplastic-like n=1 Tax=Abrus precatorius TaxID=3816 RepID=A0A8B8MJ66_ABRPR|nr:33 kDa ribonucleoprotein, chloroplastic-like [Abrus precatorius]
MAATITASSLVCNRIYNLSFIHSSISLALNFPHTPISLKPHNLILNLQFLNPYPLALSYLPLPSVSFHAFPDTEEEEDPQPQTSQKPDPRVSHCGRLFVGNLPYSLPSSQLAHLFANAGNVVSVEIVHDDITGRSRGFAFVTMGSVEDAEQAIRMFDGTEVGGRIIKVNFPEIPKRGKRLVTGSNYKGFVDSPYKIYAGNLGWDLTSQGLRVAFAKQRGFLSAKVIYERNNGKSRGYGFVSFETAEDLEAAMNAMNGVEIQGRPLQLNLAVDKKPSSSPVIHKNTGSSVDSMEMLFGVNT